MNCTHPHCHVPTGPCAHGEENYKADCEFFQRDTIAVETPAVAEAVTEFPWTGNSFGLDDLGWLAARGRPLIFVPVGPHNAGKTTFLGAIYLRLSAGFKLGQEQFAGSYTIGGWENLAAYMRYAPEGLGPQFPPHTSNIANRVPGLLHLALRSRDGVLRDIILADPPGEWFSNWATNVEHADAEGARWLAQHSDGFILFVDSEELAGSERGAARDDLFKLAQRLADHADGRPVALLWSKSDYEVRPVMREQVEERLSSLFPRAKSFSTSVNNGETAEQFLSVPSWLLDQEHGRAHVSIVPPVYSDDPFSAFRGN